MVPPKTCTLDCLYCEVGRTTTHIGERIRPGLSGEMLRELQEYLSEAGEGIDFITLAGSGEPTLNEEIGEVIDAVKSMTDKPVAVLTNGTLLYREDVRRDLSRADLVIPSLDTVRPETFLKLNRPAPGITIERLIRGIEEFRAGFPGHLWLETLLVAGYNDTAEEIEALRTAVARIRPDRVQVNTVFRPPAYASARAVSAAMLERAAGILGGGAEAVGTFSRHRRERLAGEIKEEILDLVGRRPCTAEDMARSLGRDIRIVADSLEALEREGSIRRESHDNRVFYRRAG
jgi:wyosine [tRNA(Phe)-imidazoG37] synthetase (radical SAM superfamily)